MNSSLSKLTPLKDYQLYILIVKSITSSFVKLQEYLANVEYMFDIITLSETCLDSNDSFGDYKLMTHQIYHVDRNLKGGDVAI